MVAEEVQEQCGWYYRGSWSVEDSHSTHVCGRGGKREDVEGRVRGVGERGRDYVRGKEEEVMMCGRMREG